MQRGVEQHGGVSGGEDEAIAVGPKRVGGIVIQKMLPEGVDDGGEAHRRAGMAGIGLLDGVDGQGANGVDTKLVERFCSLTVAPARGGGGTRKDSEVR